MAVYLGSNKVGFNSAIIKEITKEQKYPWLGPDAEWIKKYEWSGTLANDTTYSSWTPSTSTTSIMSATSDVLTVEASLEEEFMYYFVGSWNNNFVYVSGTTPIGATKHFVACNAVMAYKYPNNYSEYISGEYTKHSTTSLFSSSYFEYYNSSGVLAGTTGTYGPAYNTTSTSLTSSLYNNVYTFTCNRPALNAVCRDGYFSTSMAAAIDTTNSTLHHRVDVFKVPYSLHKDNKKYYFITQLLNNNYDPVNS